MRLCFNFLCILVLTTLCFNVSAQLNPVSWEFSSNYLGENEFELIATATMEDGWYTYSQEESEDGPNPTYFEYYDSDHFELVGKTTESGNRKEAFEKAFGGVKVIKFIGEGIFTQKVKVTDTSLPIEGYVTYMTCNGEMCLPPKDVEFSYTVSVPKNIVVESFDNEVPPAQIESKTSVENDVDQESNAKINLSDHESTSAKDVEKVNQIPSFGNVGKQGDTYANSGLADNDNPVVWDFEWEKLENGNHQLIFHADIADGWSLYSSYIDESVGPMPTVFEYTSPTNFEKVGDLIESDNVQTKFDKVFGAEISKFLNYATFVQEIRSEPSVEIIEGYLSYMTCNDETCLPPKDVDFLFSFNGLVDNSTIVESEMNPVALANESTRDLFNSKRDINSDEYLTDCGGHESDAKDSLLTIFILGFLGGLVALLTPCVFPMIPLTVSFFTNSAGTKAEGLRKAILYGISIIVIYILIGIVLTSIFGPTILNRMSVDPYFNMIFFVLLVVFAFSFFGFFELTLPSSWVNSSDRAADKGGVFGIFFMAFTLALVSFSCTGPIIGTLLVETVRDISPESLAFGFIPKRPLLGMFGFSVALALPFTLFAAFPAWLNSLPKSGSWMTNVKVTLGFLELAFAFKFFSVADMVRHWGIMKYELFMAIWVVIFLGLALYQFGMIRFPHDGPLKKLGTSRLVVGLASLLFSIYVGYSLYNYKPLSVMSGLAPPVHYNFFNPMDCPFGLECYKDFDLGVTAAKEQNKPIFVDFTGYGCVNCREMEENVWIQEEVLSKLKNDFIVVSLYVDDQARLFPEDKKAHLLDVNTGDRLRTVGSKWASFEISNFEKSSQPYYVLMHNDGKTILNKPIAYTPDVETYNAFLECGLSAFQSIALN